MSAPLSAPPEDGISIREFARREGCSDRLVRRAVEQGKLHALSNGKLNPDLVGTGWRHGNRHPAAGADRGADTVSAVSAPLSALSAPAEALEPQPQGGALRRRRRRAEPDAEDESLDLDAFARRVLAGDAPDLAQSEKVKAAAAALKGMVAARKAAGAVIDIELAEQVLFNCARAARDAWLNWPARVGPLLAADLNLEADRVSEALTRYVHEQLEELGEPEADFTAPGEPD
ncbi:hypothetical protein [Falsiroseomonas sp.]|uniref:hypothetical protein n=1 Tax=Falsiroseomonas sp. TaxID=2870721 RepID=UPI003F7141B4